MPTFIFWLWKGWRPVYNAEHVNTACRLLRSQLNMDHRIVCITDMPEGITECETFPLWPEPQGLVTATKPNCWRRIRLFDPEIAHQLGTRLVSMDLDFCPVARLDPVFATEDPFKIARGHFAAYNGSLWIMDAGIYPHVWSDFDPATSPMRARRARHPNRPGATMVGSDQVWLSMKIPNAPTWNHSDGVLSYALHSVGYRAAKRARLWFFPGGVKPWSGQTKKILPKVYQTYMDHWKGSKAPI